MNRHYYLSLLVLLTVLLTACSFSLAEDITPPPGSEQQMPVTRMQPPATTGPLYPLVPPNPENGRSIYAEKCAPCHGTSGQGDGPQASQLPNSPAPLGSPAVAREATPADWYLMVTQGDLERFMPPFSSLTDRQRWEVVAYSFMLSTDQVELEHGMQLYQENCSSCHGENGRGDGPEIAGLSTQPVDFTNQALMVNKSAADFHQAISEGVSPDMPAFGGQLSAEDLWALSNYLRTLTFSSADKAIAEADTPAPQEYPDPEVVETQAVDGLVEATPLAEAPHSMGEVAGTVTHASGEDIPSGLVITLHGFDDMQEVISQTTTIQNDGTFLFNDVEMLPGRVFLTTIEYQQATYGSDIAIAEPDMTSLELPVEIYGTTTDASILSVDRLHLFFEFLDENTLQVIQLYIMTNPTDQTLVSAGEGQPTVRFELPEGARNLEFQDGILGGRYVQTPDGFGDTVAIRPGAGVYEVLFSYEMPYDRGLDLVQQVAYPVNAVVILLPEGNVKIKSDMLQDEGLRDVQGAQYRVYNGSQIPAGANLEMTISGRPTGNNPSISSGSSTNIVIGLAVFGFALVVTGVWLYSRGRRTENRKKREIDEDISAVSAGPQVENAQTLMDAIIALDDLYQEGQLAEEPYLQRRSELKARLRDLMDEGDAGNS